MSRSIKVATKNRDKYIALGLNIAYYRKRSGMTQEQLAEKIGISRTHLGEIEAPNMIVGMSLEVLFNICNALNVSENKMLEFRE